MRRDERAEPGTLEVGEFRLLDKRERYSSQLFSVHTGQYASPSGVVFEREVLQHPGAVGVVPVMTRSPGEPSVVLVCQYRPATGAWVLEIPAGLRDVAGEAPEVTAARELEEEVGFRAGELRRLFHAYTSPGLSDEEVIVYLATGLEPVEARPQGQEEEFARVCEIPLDKAIRLALGGEVVDLKTIGGLFAAREALAGDLES